MKVLSEHEISQVAGGFDQHVLTVIDNGQTSYVAVDAQGALELAIAYSFAGHDSTKM